MKKTLLFLSFLIVAMESVFGQTGPTTLWSDNTDVMWYNAQDTDFNF